jgi:hypothetical protein
MQQDAREVALLQLIYAAEEGGYSAKCLRYARELALLDPEIPTVKRILAGQNRSSQRAADYVSQVEAYLRLGPNL